MNVYVVIKVDFGHREILEIFDTSEKADAFLSGYQARAFDGGSLAGISFYIEGWNVQ